MSSENKKLFMKNCRFSERFILLFSFLRKMRYLQKNIEHKSVKLDLKNRKILAILSENVRMPHTKIAKQVGLSRDAVSYRIKNLKKKGVIQEFRTVIDISHFGYDAYHLFLQLNQPTKEAEAELIEKFNKYPFIRAVLKFSGRFDYEIAIIAKDINELDDNLNIIISDCSSYIHNFELLILTSNYISKILPDSFVQNEKKLIEKLKVKKEKKIQTDKKDLIILDILSADSSTPLYDVASKIKLSTDAVKYRLKNMTEAGIIKRFIPVINYASLSLNIYVLLINIHAFDDKKESTLKQFLNQDKSVIWAQKTIGRYNVLIYLCSKNSATLHESVINLRSIFPDEIIRYETLIAFEEYKFTYFPDYTYI